MTRRVSLFEEEEAPPPDDEGSLEEIQALMEKMETILHIKTYQVGRGPWHARMTGSTTFGTGMTALDAMRDAVAKRSRA